MSIILRVSEDVHTQFKEYCAEHGTTMSKILNDYIITLLSKSEKVLPGREKISAAKEAIKPNITLHTKLPVLSSKVVCPKCKEDITDKSGADRLYHIQNCEVAYRLYQCPFCCKDLTDRNKEERDLHEQNCKSSPKQ